MVFADTHAHPDHFHRNNVARISPEELDRYRRGLIDVVVCNVSSDAAYQGGYTNRDGTSVRRLRAGQDHDIQPGFAFEFTLDRLERIYRTIAEDENVVLASSPQTVMRAKRRGLQRNAAVVLENQLHRLRSARPGRARSRHETHTTAPA